MDRFRREWIPYIIGVSEVNSFKLIENPKNRKKKVLTFNFTSTFSYGTFFNGTRLSYQGTTQFRFQPKVILSLLNIQSM